MRTAPLNYERQPPVGNTLIDDDAGVVFIRILPDRTLGRTLSWLFIVCGIGVFLYAIGQMIFTPITVLQSIPILLEGMLFFVLVLAVRYTPRTSETMIQASSAGVEYSANEFPARTIERKIIQRVFTRNAPLSRRMYFGVNLTDGGAVVLGCGEPKEIEAMARAIHRVLNFEQNRGEQSHAA